MLTIIGALLAAAGAKDAPRDANADGGAAIVEVRCIWDRAPHNAFTGLARVKGRWICAFREAANHLSHDGRIRVIASTDGRKWESAALLEPPSPLPDLRDPKITTTPDGRLMLTAAAANRKAKGSPHQTYAWFSSDGTQWGKAAAVGEPGFWLWRVTWHGGKAYGVGYATSGGRCVRLYRSDDGVAFKPIVQRLFEKGFPNEASLVFDADGTCRCLLRRDGRVANTAMLGTSRPPYTAWTWQDLGRRIGGPCIIELEDGRYVVAGRRYDGGTRTGLMWLDAKKPSLEEFLKLPSGGDTSYPGLVMHDGLLWVSYYASHEGKAKIYLAKVKLPPVRR